MKRQIPLIIMLWLIFALSGCGAGGRLGAPPHPRAVDGVLDLRQWDFEQHGAVPLNGEWELYWEELLTPDELATVPGPIPSGPIDFPGSWYGHVVQGEPLGGFGYATFRLKVLLAPEALPEKSMALKMPVPVIEAHRLYVDGQPLGVGGQPGPSRESTVPQLNPYVTAFIPAGSETEIVLQISNFHFAQGGILYDTILFGPQTQVQRLDEQRLGTNLFLTGSIFIMGLYHLGLFSLRRRDRSPLYFGLFCLLIAGTTLIGDQPQIFYHYVSRQWALYVQVRLAAAMITMASLTLFVHALFTGTSPKRGLTVILGATGMMAGLALLLPAIFMTVVYPLVIILAGLVVLYNVGVAVLAVSRRESGAIVFLLGFVPLLLALINDSLFFSGIIQTGLYVPAGLFIFIFAQAYLLSARFSDAFSRTEVLTAELQRNNQSLQQAQADLSRSEARYRAIFEDSRDVIFITGLDGRINAVNYACYELLGYTRAEALTMNATDFYANPADRALFRDTMRRTGVTNDFELKMRHKAGYTVDCQVSAITRHNHIGEVIGYQGIIHDMTATKQAEHERLRALALQKEKEAADAANEAKSAFLASMSHELRTPLNAILGFSRLIARSPNLSVKERKNVEIITSSGRHLLDLINQVLDLSKIEAGRMTYNPGPLNLPNLLAELEGMFRLQAEEKGLRLVIDYGPQVPHHFITDTLKLRQVLINLLNNALKFTARGGVLLRVTVAEGADKEIGPDVTGNSGDGLTRPVKLTFRVIDTGPGIGASEQDKLFEAFAQTRSGRYSGEGTGLGLPISQKMVTLLGGIINVESPLYKREFDLPEGGPGSCFSFSLPVEVGEGPPEKIVSPTDEPVPAEALVVGLEPGQPTYRLLVADDNRQNRELLHQLLSPLGFELHTAENGQQAIEVWQKAAPHLIFMDAQMPVLDGCQATQQIRQLADVQPKIIALTASGFMQAREKIMEVGCDGVLSEPFTEEELFAALSKHLGVRYQIQAPAGAEVPLLNGELLAKLPKRECDRLAEAVTLADVQQLDALLVEIEQQWPRVAQAMRPYIENFEYETLLTLLRQSVTTGSG
jgi:PAS domain S-box-containing protein